MKKWVVLFISFFLNASLAYAFTPCIGGGLCITSSGSVSSTFGGNITLENGEIISNSTNDQVDIKDDDGTVYVSIDANGITSNGSSQQIQNDSGAVIYFSGANIGILDSTPTASFQVGDGAPGSTGVGDVYIVNDLEVDGTIYGDGSNISGLISQDADNDTKIQVEESADEDYIRFDTAGAEAMVISNVQEVGIGQAIPEEILHILAASPILRIDSLASGQQSCLYLNEITANLLKVCSDGSNNTAYIDSNSNNLYLNKSSTRNVYIGEGGGNIKMGVVAPTLVTANKPFSFWDTTGSEITLGRSDTTVTAADTIGAMYFYMDDAELTTQNIGAQITVTADATVSTDAAASDMTIYTTGSSAGGSPVARMLFDASGYVEVLAGGLIPDKVTADPCGSGYPEGSIFYNDTSNYMCYCNGSNDVKMSDDSTACF